MRNHQLMSAKWELAELLLLLVGILLLERSVQTILVLWEFLERALMGFKSLLQFPSRHPYSSSPLVQLA